MRVTIWAALFVTCLFFAGCAPDAHQKRQQSQPTGQQQAPPPDSEEGSGTNY